MTQTRASRMRRVIGDGQKSAVDENWTSSSRCRRSTRKETTPRNAAERVSDCAACARHDCEHAQAERVVLHSTHVYQVGARRALTCVAVEVEQNHADYCHHDH